MPAGMDLIRHRAGMLLQLADHQRVNVFVGSVFEEFRLGRLFLNLVERLHDEGALASAEDAGLFQRAREGLRAADIGANQAAVERQRSREALEDLRGACFEPAAPELQDRKSV